MSTSPQPPTNTPTGQAPSAPGHWGPWQIVMGASLWGTTGTAQALAPPESTPLTVGALRQWVGAAGLLAMAAWRGELSAVRLRQWPWGLTLLAGLCMAIYQLCFFSAVARTGVAVGTVVGIGSAPIAGGLIGWLFRAERPPLLWYPSTALAVLGCSALALSGQGVWVNAWGLLLALGAGTTYALYAHFSKSILLDHAPDLVMAMVFLCGALLLLPVLVWQDWSWVWQGRGLGVVLHLGLVTTALAYALFARGLGTVPIATAMTLTLAEPLTAAVLGLVVLGEPLSLLSAGGMACILAGLLLLAQRAGRAA